MVGEKMQVTHVKCEKVEEYEIIGTCVVILDKGEYFMRCARCGIKRDKDELMAKPFINE